jgi:uncharacterized protein
VPRAKLPWPKGRAFKILSLDGGGIRGLYTACLLHKIEQNFCRNGVVGDYFDLLAGTSTGGIISVGLGFAVPTERIVDLYARQGEKIFPPTVFKKPKWRRLIANAHSPKYDHRPLERALFEVLGEQTFGESRSRLVVPSCMMPSSEIAVFKTDHHPDFQRDHKMFAWEVCRATSAAPTYFAGHERNGRMFIDGGLWANNPILVAVTEALSCFDIAPSQIQVLSIGTGNQPFELSLKEARGGLYQWMFALTGAMHLSTENAASQVSLFIGDQNVVRIEPEKQIAAIELDDWCEAKAHMPDAAENSFVENRTAIESFFQEKVDARVRMSSDAAVKI